jgi:hypothetical protein
MDRRHDDADTDAIVPARPGRGPVGESVLDDLAADLLLSRGQDRDGATPAGVPALPATGVAVAPDAADGSLPLDQDVPSARSAAGLVVFGLAAGLWAARGRSILDARQRQPVSRSSRGKSLDLGSGTEAW